MSKPKLQHRLEDRLVAGMQSVIGGISAGAAARVGQRVGGLVRSPLGIRKGVVEENLRLAFPEADDAWIERTTRESYRHLGREVASMLRLASLDRVKIGDLVQIPDEDWRMFEEALAEGRGVLLATGHYGNWEMAAAAVAARGVPIEAIVKRQSNPLVNARIEATRRNLGVETVDMGEASRKVPRSLLSGKAIGIVADQDARGSGIFVPFFGVPASTHRGPALFALRVGSPLIAAVARRLPDGRYRLTGQRVDVQRTDDMEADVERVTAALARHLEEEIRQDPSQYFWFHKRWKTRPRKEPLPHASGTTGHVSPGNTSSGG